MNSSKDMSGLGEPPNGAQMQGFPDASYGQSYPGHYPGYADGKDDPLGSPMSVGEVARMIGCSAWTVRNRYLRQGLPYLRSGPNGRLIFYRKQVTKWLLAKQQKGGNNT